MEGRSKRWEELGPERDTLITQRESQRTYQDEYLLGQFNACVFPKN
jgi:hypothetical protein